MCVYSGRLRRYIISGSGSLHDMAKVKEMMYIHDMCIQRTNLEQKKSRKIQIKLIFQKLSYLWH